ncbi:MAG: sugar kinase [Kurthia sp.]|nr:sugar kinase [Candidatus Kurthia equi]
MAEVVTIGETMMIFQTTQVGNLEDFNAIQQKIGGAESNYSIGLARLGHSVKYMSRVGGDPFGKKILKTIRAEGVDVSEVKVIESARTGLLFKEQKYHHKMNIYYYRDESAASKMSIHDLPVDFFENVCYFHVTGITPAISDSCRELIFSAIQFAKESGAKIIFDPNLRFKLWSKEQAFQTLNKIVELSDYILAGEEEATFLTNEEEEQQMCKALSRGDASKVIILKRGERPSLIFENGRITEVPTQRVNTILDSVGAGDAFAAGFTHGLLLNKSLVESVNFGNYLGACVIQQYGDIEGLPTLNELDELIENKSNTDVLR